MAAGAGARATGTPTAPLPATASAAPESAPTCLAPLGSSSPAGLGRQDASSTFSPPWPPSASLGNPEPTSGSRATPSHTGAQQGQEPGQELAKGTRSYKEMALLGRGESRIGHREGAAPGRGNRTSISLPALANSLGRSSDRRCGLVESGGDLVDVVETNHGEDEAMRAEGKRPLSCWAQEHARVTSTPSLGPTPPPFLNQHFPLESHSPALPKHPPLVPTVLPFPPAP